MKFENRLENFLSQSIGLKRGEVSLLPHNPLWTQLFKDEAKLIQEQLAVENLILHHCGSTAIEGIAAKPIIDIVGDVASLKSIDERSPQLESLGYECKGEYGIPGRRYSVLYDREKRTGFVHLHMIERKDPQIEKHLVFRDFLRANRDSALLYETEKMRLLKAGVPRSSYSESKSEVISQLLARALAWKRNN